MAITIQLSKQIYPSYKYLLNELGNLGYSRVPMVLSPGEFSVRGSIIDIFAVNHNFPIRIEYDEDQIERLNSFNVHDQKSISKLDETQIISVSEGKDLFPASALGGSIPNVDLLSDFEEGCYVVHEDYGIGIYRGLRRLSFNHIEGEYLFIQYKDEDKLYVPLEQFNRIFLYSDSEFTPQLNSLSDGAWKRTKTKAKKDLDELAEDVYLMSHIRQNTHGHSFTEDTVWQIDLEESFEHPDTADQMKITQEIKKDMESTKPMDRVLCGDVGYGKTEIIVRAAFKAAENHKQTAILVPTTILADQHYRVFSERFKRFHHKVEVLSRFRSKEEQKKILEDLKNNDIKVVIGTHRLLQKDIQFADLGLLVIDEEQRFGVSHKEKIKKLKNNVDVISLSATPIPRTLYMALTGAKDFSILKTPPKARKPILTTVAPITDDIIQKAVNDEIKSGGQVFYLFNNVKKILFKHQKLKRLFPNLKIGIGHGQMQGNQLEQVIFDFIHKKYDILLCTTIIENGVDIPNTNTIIVENAHLFGLSQIHQIRGRVGRTEKQAFAYLLYPKDEILSTKAEKRLKAIKEYAALGAGYKLALKDLEIRGAGTLLGRKQHGHMTAIGFDLYCKLLEESVHKLQKDETKKRKPTLIIEKNIATAIPEFYIPSERERLSIYRRLSNLMYQDQLDELLAELEDRYGKIPKCVQPLFNTIRNQLLSEEH